MTDESLEIDLPHGLALASAKDDLKALREAQKREREAIKRSVERGAKRSS